MKQVAMIVIGVIILFIVLMSMSRGGMAMMGGGGGGCSFDGYSKPTAEMCKTRSDDQIMFR